MEQQIQELQHQNTQLKAKIFDMSEASAAVNKELQTFASAVCEAQGITITPNMRLSDIVVAMQTKPAPVDDLSAEAEAEMNAG